MGKYKQWLHHQEVGRRLREQIATYEQERERVQRMAPSHPTTLPDTANPLIRALLDYTGRGGMLGRAAVNKVTGDPHQRQPAGISSPTAYAATPSAPAMPVAPLSGVPASPQASVPPAAPVPTDDPVVARLAASAAAQPADPLEAMRRLAQQSRQPTTPASPGAAPSSPAAAPETSSEWLQRFRGPQQP